MLNVTFVILHYENLLDTECCIESILQYLNKFPNISIIVVDNGSVAEKIDKIENDFRFYNNIYFIRSEKNLGFAKGNNLGYIYAKKFLNPDIIILSNNDIVYNQEDFLERLELEYINNKFDIAGPNIIRISDNINQNPEPKVYNDIKDVRMRLIKFRVLYLLSIFNVDNILARMLGKRFVYVNKTYDDDYQLHGACLIFGKRYINKYDGLYDKTFMYGEESILKYIADRDGLTMKFLQTLSVNHTEGASVASVFGKGNRNRKFYYKWNINSCKVLLELMSNDNINE